MPSRPLSADEINRQVQVHENLLSRLHREQQFSLNEYRDAWKAVKAARLALHSAMRFVGSTIRSLSMVEREIAQAKSSLAKLRAA